MSVPISQNNSSAATTGLLPQLYLHAVGPVGTAYYERVFTRFETLGRTPPTWNHAAAFCTLGWCLLRGLWRPAALWSSMALLLAVLVWAGAFSALPRQAQVSVALLGAIVLCGVPGFFGNGWYYRLVHQQTMHALEESPSLAQAQARLAQQASSQKQWRLAAVGQVALWALLGVFAWHSADSAPEPEPEPAPAPERTVGPPQLNFPEPTTTAPAEEVAPPGAAAPLAPPESTLAMAPSSAMTETTATAAPPGILPITMAEAMPAPAAPAPTPAPAPKVAAPKAAPAPKAAAPVAKTTRSKPTPPPAAAPQEKPARTNSQFYVTLGTYAEVTNAAAVERKVRQAGYAAQSFSTTSNKGVLTRLRAGPFATRAEAEKAQRALRAQRIPASVQEQRR
ncbi:SPOR domain-containing protein [Comamonas denitrificans]|uniref:SPOR domain-containing protein n=1 Tax=Comamonas denitrificans TaxID=117506 RepID=UPI00361586CA